MTVVKLTDSSAQKNEEIIVIQFFFFDKTGLFNEKLSILRWPSGTERTATRPLRVATMSWPLLYTLRPWNTLEFTKLYGKEKQWLSQQPIGESSGTMYCESWWVGILSEGTFFINSQIWPPLAANFLTLWQRQKFGVKQVRNDMLLCSVLICVVKLAVEMTNKKSR